MTRATLHISQEHGPHPPRPPATTTPTAPAFVAWMRARYTNFLHNSRTGWTCLTRTCRPTSRAVQTGATGKATRAAELLMLTDDIYSSNRGDRAQSPLQTVKDTADGPSSPSPVTEQPRHTQPTGRDIDSAGRLSQPQDSATEHHSTVQESKQVHSRYSRSVHLFSCAYPEYPSGKRKSPDHTTALDGPSCKKLRKDARIVTNGSSEQQSASSVPVVAIPEERRGVRSSSTCVCRLLPRHSLLTRSAAVLPAALLLQTRRVSIQAIVPARADNSWTSGPPT